MKTTKSARNEGLMVRRFSENQSFQVRRAQSPLSRLSIISQTQLSYPTSIRGFVPTRNNYSDGSRGGIHEIWAVSQEERRSPASKGDHLPYPPQQSNHLSQSAGLQSRDALKKPESLHESPTCACVGNPCASLRRAGQKEEKAIPKL